MVQKPGDSKVSVVDGRHRALADRKLGRPLRCYVGFPDKDKGPWDRMSDYQQRDHDTEKSAGGYSLSARSGMISLDLPEGLITPLPGGVDDHHVTVVYLGPDVNDQAFDEACRRARDAARQIQGPLTGMFSGIDSFPPSAGSDGKTPVFVPAHIPGAEQLREALADLSASEHTDWRPHCTLAYLDDGDPMPGLQPPVTTAFGHLTVHRGDDVRRFPFGGVAKSAEHGSAEVLREYWTHDGHPGPTQYALEQKIRWGQPDDWYRCVDELTPYIGGEGAKGYCNLRHHEVLGYWPAQHAQMEKEGEDAGGLQ